MENWRGALMRSWWNLVISDYPAYVPNDVDVEHSAELVKQGFTQGELVQEDETEDEPIEEDS